MENEQVSRRAGRYCVCAAPIVAEFYEHGRGIKLLDNRTHLSARKPLGGNIGE